MDCVVSCPKVAQFRGKFVDFTFSRWIVVLVVGVVYICGLDEFSRFHAWVLH